MGRLRPGGYRTLTTKDRKTDGKGRGDRRREGNQTNESEESDREWNLLAKQHGIKTRNKIDKENKRKKNRDRE